MVMTFFSVLLGLVALVGLFLLVTFWPMTSAMMSEIAQPGSGGGAQMFIAIFVITVVVGPALCVLGGGIGSYLLTVAVVGELRRPQSVGKVRGATGDPSDEPLG